VRNIPDLNKINICLMLTPPFVLWTVLQKILWSSVWVAYSEHENKEKYTHKPKSVSKTFIIPFGMRFYQQYFSMMTIIFWEMTPCGSYKNRRFGGSYRLHLQGARVRAGYRANYLRLPRLT
jgi:hypothetical protein